MLQQVTGPCQAQPREPHGVQRLEIPSNCPLHGLCALELGCAAPPAWPRLGLESCTFTGFLVLCHNFGAHQQWHG